MIFAESLATGCRDSSAAARSIKAERPTLLCRTVAELANDVHWPNGLPVEADRPFRSPTSFVPKPWSAGIDVATADVYGPTFDPPVPALFNNRGRTRRRCLFRYWRSHVGGAGILA